MTVLHKIIMHVKKITVEDILNIKIKHCFTVIITFFFFFFYKKAVYPICTVSTIIIHQAQMNL